MAKTEPATTETGLQIIKPAQVQKLIEKACAELKITEEGMNKMRAFLTLEIKGVDDTVQYKAVEEAAKSVKTTRLAVDKKRSELTKPAYDFKKGVDKTAKEAVDEMKAIEESLREKLKLIDQEAEAIKRKEAAEKRSLLVDAGFQFDGTVWIAGKLLLAPESFESMTLEEITKYAEEGKKELEEIRKAEEERLAAEAKEREEREAKEREAQEALQKERAEREAKERENEELRRKLAELEAKNAPEPQPEAENPQPEAETPQPQPDEPREKAPAPKSFGQPLDPAPTPQPRKLTEYERGWNEGLEAVIHIFSTSKEKKTKSAWADHFRSLKK